MSKLPYTINAIVRQLGSGLTGAVNYCGGRKAVYKYSGDPSTHDGEYRPDYSSKVTPEGCIDSPVSIWWSVNGKRGEDWKICVSYEPDDTYTVRLWRKVVNLPGQIGEVLTERRDVYTDTLKGTFEEIYDEAICKYNDGAIPLD